MIAHIRKADKLLCSYNKTKKLFNLIDLTLSALYDPQLPGTLETASIYFKLIFCRKKNTFTETCVMDFNILRCANKSVKTLLDYEADVL